MHNFVNINHTSTSHTDRLNVNGNITATGTITGSSDDRIKYNEVNINGANMLYQLLINYNQKNMKN